jgi:outer membrane protein OmpA-like peptidoglycan-associated protein
MKLYIVLVLLILSSATVFAQSDKLESKGDKMLEEKNYSSAITFYEQALLGKEADPTLNFKIAQCYLLSSPKTRALDYALKAVNNSPKPSNDMYFTLARAYHLNHQLDKAMDCYKKSDPGNTNKKAITKYIQECNYGKQYMADPQDYKITNAGLINSQFHDYLPYILPDLSKIYFTSRRPGSTGGKKEKDGLFFEDIYVAGNKGGAWDEPVNIGGPVNSDMHDACIGISPNGEVMFVYKSVNGGDIYQSFLKGKSWTNPEPMPFNSEAFETSACLSPDERTLFFVRAENVSGNRDLFMCSRTVGGQWSAARKVPGLNTPYDEDAPFMHPDGKTLYFSSKGHTSMGGYDIFRCVKKTDGTWSAPENLGYPVNTAGDDVYFVLSADGKRGFYASDKEGGQGKQDIYSIRMPVKNEPALALVKGTITDETGKPVEADITITDNSSKEVIAKFESNSASGEYMISLPSGKNYGITVEKKGKLFYSDNISLSEDAGFREIRNGVKLESAKPGAKVVLRNIFFDVGKSDLRAESEAEMQRFVKLLKDNPAIKIEVSGHTDNVGNAEANLALSEARAKKVVAYLVANGIAADRLQAKGYGSSKPVTSNDTEEGRQKNRRTEFKIL